MQLSRYLSWNHCWQPITVIRNSKDGGWQAFGHWADHRCTKDAAEERAGLKPGPYKGNFGCAQPFDGKTVTSGEWRENEKRWRARTKSRVETTQPSSPASDHPTKDGHPACPVPDGERAQRVEGSLFAPRHVRRWEFIQIGRRGRWWR